MILRQLTLSILTLVALVGCSRSTPPAAAQRLVNPAPARPSTAPSTPAALSFKLTGEFAIGGEGRWDYVTCDRDAQRLYVPRSDRVMILSSQTGTILGTIPGTPGVHGVALAKHLRRGFTSNGGDGTVTVFDFNTFTILGKVPAGKNPDAIIYDSFTRRIFVFNGKSHDATVIEAGVDPANPVAAGTIPLGGKPEFAVADHTGQIFVNIEDTAEIVRIDAKTLQVTARWPIAPGEEPTGLAMDLKNRRLFAACGNKILVIANADTGQVVATLPTGSGSDAAAFDPELNLVLVSNGEGTLTVIREDSPDKFTVVDNVPTRKGAHTMALDTRSHRVYLPTAQFGPTSAPSADNPRPRPPMIPDSFTILVVER